MPSFEQPPDWWIALANLTDWFEWPAIAAGLTLLVLRNTVRLANRAKQEAREKEGAFLLGVAQEIAAAAQIARTYVEHGEAGDQLTSAKTAIELFARLEIRKRLGSIPMTAFPNGKSFSAFLAAKVAIEHVYVIIEADANNKRTIRDNLTKKIEEVGNYVQKLRQFAGELGAGEDHAITQSLKSLPARLRTTWIGLPLPWRRQKASADKKA